MPAQETSSRSEVFVGRTREFAQLRDALEEVCDGRGRLFLVHGEPGIGKTSLAEQTEGTCNEDICSYFTRNYKRSNFYDQIQDSPFQNS